MMAIEDSSRWIRELKIAVGLLVIGALLLPLLIFLCGVTFLGRYDGASLAKTYATVFVGLGSGSIASWVVVLGPYALIQLFRALHLWWNVGT